MGNKQTEARLCVGEGFDSEERSGRRSRGEQLLKSEGHQVQMFDVTGVREMHSGYTAPTKSVHMFSDLWVFTPTPTFFAFVVEILFLSCEVVIMVKAGD